jgi:hypothetical protein
MSEVGLTSTEVFVLDVLLDDVESLPLILDILNQEGAPYQRLHFEQPFDVKEVQSSIGSLIEKEHIMAYQEKGEPVFLTAAPKGTPLEELWYCLTDKGRETALRSSSKTSGVQTAEQIWSHRYGSTGGWGRMWYPSKETHLGKLVREFNKKPADFKDGGGSFGPAGSRYFLGCVVMRTLLRNSEAKAIVMVMKTALNPLRPEEAAIWGHYRFPILGEIFSSRGHDFPGPVVNRGTDQHN